ncbi:hypothetical protein [Candidatus Lokiarchaeum ossiferum]|uniref:hypothetical protein n=1 Tax=Candidatus Lokiarchaeum ossiferum TaxID=2951803 RepID=UPI00352D224E
MIGIVSDLIDYIFSGILKLFLPRNTSNNYGKGWPVIVTGFIDITLVLAVVFIPNFLWKIIIIIILVYGIMMFLDFFIGYLNVKNKNLPGNLRYCERCAKNMGRFRSVCPSCGWSLKTKKQKKQAEVKEEPCQDL